MLSSVKTFPSMIATRTGNAGTSFASEDASGPLTGADSQRSRVLVQAELRRHAAYRLALVAGGGAPRPVEPELARAMAQVAFATQVGEDVTSRSPIFVALLAHEDLPEDILEWIVHDRAVYEADVYPHLLSHPAFTFRVMAAAIEVSMWDQRGCLYTPVWSERSLLVAALEVSGHAGEAAAFLLGLWSGPDFPVFAAALSSLVAAPPAALEILTTLAEDLRVERTPRTHRLPDTALEVMIEKAVLLADDLV